VLRSADEQVELRVEYRSVKTLRRLRTWRVRLLCRECAIPTGWTMTAPAVPLRRLFLPQPPSTTGEIPNEHHNY
jgi:hypothetical protein